jgi:hypothetical protein
VKTVSLDDAGRQAEAPEDMFERRFNGRGASAGRTGYGNYRVLLGHSTFSLMA